MLNEASKEFDDDERKALVKWALASESHTRLEAMLAETQDLLEVELDELDRNLWLLNCQNGTIDLKTGELRPHDKGDYITSISPVAYEPNAKREEWEAFIAKITGNNNGLASYLQRCSGYTCTGDTSEQSFFFAYGDGMNGKSTFLNAMRKVLGPYAMQAEIETFLTTYKPQKQAHSEDVANLRGKRYVLTTEVPENRRLAVNRMKAMTGGERVRASHKHEKEIEFDVTYKIWMLGNTKPDITESTHAIWRRVKLIPFTVKIYKREEIKNYCDKLIADEGPAILAWFVQGCLDWQREGLGEPEEVIAATNEYRREQDNLLPFLEEYSRPERGKEGKVLKSTLKTLYETWVSQQGISPLKQRQFKKQLLSKGITDDKSGEWYWLGLALLSPEQKEARDKGTVKAEDKWLSWSEYLGQDGLLGQDIHHNVYTSEIKEKNGELPVQNVQLKLENNHEDVQDVQKVRDVGSGGGCGVSSPQNEDVQNDGELSNFDEVPEGEIKI